MNIVIYHSNDFHSDFNNLKKVNSYLRKNKTKNDLYFDSGDYTDLSSIIVEADGGKSAMKLMVDSQLDAMAIGNNEIDLGCCALEKLTESGIPLISTNLRNLNNASVQGVLSSKIFIRAGKRLLVLGLSPYYSKDLLHEAYDLFFMMGGLRTHEPIELLKEEIEKQKEKYDYCILLSHSGLGIDQMILEAVSEIDLCLGGHTHDIETYRGYSQSGKGEKLGKITLEVIEGQLVEVENIQLDLKESNDLQFDKLYSEIEKSTDRILSKPLSYIRELPFTAFKQSELINFICDALMKESHYECDLAIMHAGIAEKALVHPISRKSLIETFPSKLNPTKYKINGKELREAIHLSFDDENIRRSGKGAGFRGSVLGTLGFSRNVKIIEESRVITIDGQLLEDDKSYLIITDDYLQRGSGYPSLKVADSEAIFEPGFIRDLVEKYLMDEELFKFSKEIRIF